MRAALPVALSSTLSTAGSGLLLWTGLLIAMAPAGSAGALRGLHGWALLLAIALLAAAPVAAVVALPPPRRPATLWRGATRWQRRRLMADLVALLLAVAMLLVIATADRALGWIVSSLLLPAALLTVIVGAMATPASTGGSAGPSGLAALARLLAALFTGLALLFALMSKQLPIAGDALRMAGLLLVLASLLTATQALAWREAAHAGDDAPSLRWRALVGGLWLGPSALLLVLEALRPGSLGLVSLGLAALAALAGVLLERRRAPALRPETTAEAPAHSASRGGEAA